MISKKGGIFPKIFWCVALIVALFFGFCEGVTKEVSDKIVRLHVVANSNSEIDRAVKFSVRDAILAEANKNANGKDLTLLSVEEQKDELKRAAERVLEKQNCTYGCTIETGRFSFPVKSYENITLPAGKYDAVRVVLGEGGGENWWCVMFPPLCFTKSVKGEFKEEEKTKLKKLVSEETYAAISDEVISLKPAFKAVELWNAFTERVKTQSDKRMVYQYFIEE